MNSGQLRRLESNMEQLRAIGLNLDALAGEARSTRLTRASEYLDRALDALSEAGERVAA